MWSMAQQLTHSLTHSPHFSTEFPTAITGTFTKYMKYMTQIERPSKAGHFGIIPSITFRSHLGRPTEIPGCVENEPMRMMAVIMDWAGRAVQACPGEGGNGGGPTSQAQTTSKKKYPNGREG